jgi:hypothetical protein
LSAGSGSVVLIVFSYPEKVGCQIEVAEHVAGGEVDEVAVVVAAVFDSHNLMWSHH